MAARQSLHADRIIQDPDILHGKPVIKGTRIPVQIVLEYLAHNPNFDDLFADYPRLTVADVQACLDYAQRLVPDDGTHDVALADRPRSGGQGNRTEDSGQRFARARRVAHGHPEPPRRISAVVSSKHEMLRQVQHDEAMAAPQSE